MPKHWLRIFILFLVCGIWITACSEAQQKKEAGNAGALKYSQVFLTDFLEDPAKKVEWGFSEYHIIGRYSGLEDVYLLYVFPVILNWTTTGNTKVDLDISLLAAHVEIPIWVVGKDLDGKKLKLVRSLSLQLTRPSDSSDWQLAGYDIIDHSLSFLRQAWGWLLDVVFGPIVLFLLLCVLMIPFSAGNWEGALKLAYWITAILSIPLVGWCSYVCFGSWWAVVIGIALVLLVPYAIVTGIRNY
jgi:hypothetical protein